MDAGVSTGARRSRRATPPAGGSSRAGPMSSASSLASRSRAPAAASSAPTSPPPPRSRSARWGAPAADRRPRLDDDRAGAAQPDGERGPPSPGLVGTCDAEDRAQRQPGGRRAAGRGEPPLRLRERLSDHGASGPPSARAALGGSEGGLAPPIIARVREPAGLVRRAGRASSAGGGHQ